MKNFMNKLTDIDGGWWPFLYLRPKKTEYMTSKIVLKMSLHYGPMYSILMYILTISSIEEFNIIDASIFLLIYPIFFFVFYRVTFAYFWNLRVDEVK